jgi:hypothetical protein
MNLRERETPGQFAARIGIALKTFSRKIRHPQCPQNFDAEEGPTGRFKSLRASPELEAFMRADPRTTRHENLGPIGRAV